MAASVCNDSPLDRGQIGINLGKKHVIYQKSAYFLYKKDFYINRPESVIFSM